MAGIFASIFRALRKSTNYPIKLFLIVPLLLVMLPAASVSASMLEIAELLTHPEQYDRQEVVVSGQVTNVQLATNRQGQPAYGFLLKDTSGTVKVIGLGQVEVK